MDPNKVAVHDQPVWRDRSDFIINAELAEEGRFEQLFVRRLGEDRFAAVRGVRGPAAVAAGDRGRAPARGGAGVAGRRATRARRGRAAGWRPVCAGPGRQPAITG